MTDGDQPRRRQEGTCISLAPAEWALAGTALAFNILYNAFPRSRLQVPAGLVAGASSSLLARQAGVPLQDQGLNRKSVQNGVAVGMAAAVPIVVASLSGLAIPRTRGLYAWPAIASASPARAAYEVFLRIPFGTALPEELIFRGAVQGILCRRYGPSRAIVLSSLLFGLWHVAPALRQSGIDGLGIRSRKHRMLHAWASVVVTAGSGLFLGWLRYRSASILAPWIAHTAANSSGYAAGWISLSRRPGVVPPTPSRDDTDIKSARMNA